MSDSAFRWSSVPVIANLETARTSVNHLVRLTNLLFDTAQARSGNLEVQVSRCDLAEVVRD